MNKAIEKLNQKNEQVNQQNSNLATLYQTVLKDKDALQTQVLQLTQERERTENSLIEKALKFSTLSEQVEKERSKLMDQRRKMDAELREINELKAMLKGKYPLVKKFSCDQESFGDKSDKDEFIEIKN